MKLLITVLSIASIALVVVGCAESAQPKAEGTAGPVVAAPESPEKVEAEIIQLEHEWVDAIVKKDTATLDRLFAPEFNGTSPSGATFPRTDAIEQLKAGEYAVESMNLDEVSVNVYGNTAVAFTSQQEKSKVDGKDNSGHYHFTNVWVKRDGKWQVVASHGSRYHN
jgi:ketosteroid isomerase-like protein